MINIILNDNVTCTTVVAGEATPVTHAKGTCFMDVTEYTEPGTLEWQCVDADMNSTFVPQHKCSVITATVPHMSHHE